MYSGSSPLNPITVVPISAPSSFLAASWVQAMNWSTASGLRWSWRKLEVSLPWVGLFTARVSPLLWAYPAKITVQPCSPALKLILPSSIGTMRLACPSHTATADTAPAGTGLPMISSPAGTVKVESIWTRAHILRSGRSRENLPPEKPLGYLASSMSHTFIPLDLASLTAVFTILNHPFERYSYGNPYPGSMLTTRVPTLCIRSRSCLIILAFMSPSQPQRIWLAYSAGGRA